MLIFLGALALLSAQAASPVALPKAPGARESLGPSLAALRKFAAGPGEALWPGYGTATFEFLLIDADQEILLCRDKSPPGFTDAGTDPGTGCSRRVRARSQMPGGLLAAMPLFGPPPTIVMGTPKSTGRSNADWLRTILHEHFHQWQFSLPSYFARIDALDLKGGDETGMWALNFAFPYDRPSVVAAQSAAAHALADALAARRTSDFYARFDAYLSARRALAVAAGARNWRYAEFQLWQEGVARWTEIELGKLYPDSAVSAGAVTLEERTLAQLRSPDIAAVRREFVYAQGAGEAMLLDACGPAWRAAYRASLSLGPLLEEARLSCGRKR